MLLKPAAPGTGVIAAGGVRAVLELAGVRDILTKSLGTTNPINLVRATVAGLQSLKTPEGQARLRGISVAQVLGLDQREEPAGEAAPRGGRGGLSCMTTYLEITQVKSAIGRKPDHRGTLRALGLKRIRHTVVHEDTPVIRGMVNKVAYLLEVRPVTKKS